MAMKATDGVVRNEGGVRAGVLDGSPEQREAVGDLVAATRALMRAAAATSVDVEVIRRAEASILAATEELGARSRTRPLRPEFHGPATARDAGPETSWPMFVHNPLGIPLEIRFGEDEAWARLLPNPLHEGPPDCVHGGFSAHLLDCMLGTLMQARGSRSLTASLELTYRRRTPLDEPLDLYSRIVEIDGRKTIAEGWIACNGERTVTARGVFVRVDRE